jgi:hypothetical protein
VCSGSALLTALMLITAPSLLVMSMLTAGVSGTQVLSQQDDDYRLRCAAESCGNLAVENLWSNHLRTNGGGAGNIATFRSFLANEGVLPGANGAFGAVYDMLPRLALSQTQAMDHAKVDSLTLLRRDRGYATELFFTVTSRPRRGEGFSKGGTLRTMQIVYSIQPAEFEGPMNVNGAMICADLGLLAPGTQSSKTQNTQANLPGSPYNIGLTLNYDDRIKDLLDIPNPFEVHLRRMLWVPMGSQ